MTEHSTPSSATRVTLFEDRAEVCRRAQITTRAGASWHSISGLSLFVDDRSLQVRVLSTKSPTRVLAARIVRTVDQSSTLDAEAVRNLEEALREVEVEVQRQNQRIERHESSAERAYTLFGQWLDAITQIPHLEGSPLATWRTSHNALLDHEREHIVSRYRQVAERTELELQLANTRARLEEGRALKTRIEACAEVLIESDVDGEVELELVYRTPCAQWRPEHLLRLRRESDDAATGSVELVTYATAWQRTGERWDDVELRFSTARPSQASDAPTLDDDRLFSRRKSSEERKHIVVEARDEDIDTVSGSQAASEMPGVDDGGEPLILEARQRTSLPSNGQPSRVEVQRASLDVDIACVLIPERSPVAHLRAQGTWTGSLPILAGPARIARGGSLMGRSRIDFIAPGGRFEVGFGPETAVRCTRELETDRDRTAITGTQHLQRTVTLYLSNLSGSTRSVHITERVPVSELSEVSITVNAPGWKHDTTDGFLTRTVSLQPRAHIEVEAEHTIEAKSSVHLPW